MGVQEERVIVTSAYKDLGVKEGIRTLRQDIEDTTGNVKRHTTILKKLAQVQKVSYQKLSQAQQDNWRSLKELAPKYKLNTEQLLKNRGVVERNGLLYKKITKTTEKFAESIKKTTSNIKPFRMELLSVMFGAQMVRNAMFDLLRPAMEATGIFEIFGATLKLFFLPIAIDLMNTLLPVLTAIMNAPPWVKELVGAFTLFIGITAGLVALAAAFALLHAGLVATAVTFSTTALPLLAIIAGIALLIVAVLLIKKHWREVWDWVVEHITNIKNSINSIIDGMVDYISKKLLPIKNWINDYIIQPINTAINKVAEALGLQDKDSERPKYKPGDYSYGYVHPPKKNVGYSGSWASGGIFNRPTVATIGEAGPEAVVPLSQGGSFGNVTINNYNTISSMLDIDAVVDKVSSQLADNFTAMSR